MNLPQGQIPFLRVYKCDKCYQIKDIDDHQNWKIYSVQLFKRRSDTIGSKQKTFIMKAYSDENNTRMYNLCMKWNTHLDKDSTNISFDMGWCSFIWSYLINENIQKKYGDHIYIFITLEWRHWWLQTLHNKFISVYKNISIGHPFPAFKDMTMDREK